jgi:hypothetical protein
MGCGRFGEPPSSNVAKGFGLGVKDYDFWAHLLDLKLKP